MADCKVCSKPVTTHWYVRAKVEDPKKDDVFVGLSSDGKSTRITRIEGSCTGHELETISNTIFGAYAPAAYPVRLLWSPEVFFGTTPDSKKRHIRAVNVDDRKTLPEKLKILLGVV